MKIVVLDGYTENPGDLSWDGLKALGDLKVYDRSSLTDPNDAIKRIGDAEIVFTNKTPITKQVFDACPNIKFIAVLATGYNVVDTAYAKEKGIPVSNVPTYGTDSVSQFAIALLLELCHHIGHHSKTVFEGKWQNHIDWCYWDFPLIELAGKTMGIIGFGRIGHRTGQIAKALNMNVIVNDSFKNPDFVAEGFEYVDRDTLFAKSDVVVLHCPLFPDTKGIINKDSIKKMKDGVMIINNSRGPLIVEQDLCDALNSGKVAGAAVDVVSTEPIKSDNPLLKAKNCIITPHMSWGAKEARQRIMDISVANVKAFLDGRPQNVVNK
ncbi:MAG: D-2-hydroxyacid dehydrogenase [Spirochaetales bacterium]|nr:D-2-hydroxyacid dehydrogenase [Spirochaetales bacterium]